MALMTDIRPAVTSVSLRVVLAGLDIQGFCAAGGQLAQITGSPFSLCGITMSSDDCESDWLFVVIPGLKQHGIRFVHVAIEAEVSVVLIDEDGRAQTFERGLGILVIQVTDPHAIVSQLCANIYAFPAIRLTTMAVIGMNGRTTASYLMRAAIASRSSDALLCGTMGTRTGPISFEAMRTTAEAPVIACFLATAEQYECGVGIVKLPTHALSLHRVDDVVFDVAVFTNLQYDYLDYYGDMESYFQAETPLFTPEHSRRSVVCADDEWGHRLAQQTTVLVTTTSALTKETANWQIRDVTPDQTIGRTMFTLVDPSGVRHHVVMPVPSEVNTQNTVVTTIGVVNLGIDLADVISTIKDAPQILGYMEKVNSTPDDQPLVIVDCTHTPEALEWALRSACELTSDRVVVVFGTDGDRDTTKHEHLVQITAYGTGVLWVTNESPRTEVPQEIRDYLLHGIASVRPDMGDVIEITTCRRDAVQCAILAAGSGDTVIITGKGAEWYRKAQGIHHRYNDVPVAAEVLAGDARSHE